MATTVFFASNRVRTGPADVVGSYGPNIQPPSQTDAMDFGTAFVDGIDIGTNAQGRITDLQNLNVGSFASDTMGDLGRAGRNLLLFIHGFDNTFEDCITRAAFNREWIAGSLGAATDTSVIAFSWPSLGQIVSFPLLQADYLHDQNMARLSGIHLMTFFAQLEPILRTARANNCRTFLLAHSMGNLALESAVENWFLHGNGDAQLFDLAILAAADCAFRTFNQPNLARLSGLPRLTGRTCIYYSHVDHVLQLSSVVNGAQRLGQDGPSNKSDQSSFPPAQYSMVDATGFRDFDFNFLSSHQYYRQSPEARGSIAAQMA
jgi:esterase/lipase superfamily enzyme